jgi:hypothetical protein
MNKEEFCPHKSRVSQHDQNHPHYFFVSCVCAHVWRLIGIFNYRVYAIDKHQPNTLISILETLQSRIGMLLAIFMCRKSQESMWILLLKYCMLLGSFNEHGFIQHHIHDSNKHYWIRNPCTLFLQNTYRSRSAGTPYLT